jgi:hypothetical protein
VFLNPDLNTSVFAGLLTLWLAAPLALGGIGMAERRDGVVSRILWVIFGLFVAAVVSIGILITVLLASGVPVR